MIFGTPTKLARIPQPVSLNIANHALLQVNNYKYLGSTYIQY